MFRAINTHHIHSHNFMRTNTVSDTTSPYTFDNPPAILYLDTKCTNTTQCALPPNFSPIQASSPDITIACMSRISPAPCLNNDNDNNRSSSILEFAHADPLRSTDNLPAILPAESRSSDMMQCIPSLPSLQQVSHPLDFDHTQASAPEITHTPPALRLDDDADNNNNGQSNIDVASLVSTARYLDTLDAGRTFDTLDAGCTFDTNDAILANNSNKNNCSNINATSSVKARSINIYIPSPTSASTAARDNEPEFKIKDKCTCTLPLKVRTQLHPIIAPPPDKPEELPPHWTHMDAVDNSSVSDIAHGNKPEHECIHNSPLDSSRHACPKLPNNAITHFISKPVGRTSLTLSSLTST